MPLHLHLRAARPSAFPRTLFLHGGYYRPTKAAAAAKLLRPFSASTVRPGILGLDRDPKNWKPAPTPEQLAEQRRRTNDKSFAVYPQPPGAYSKVCREPLKAINDYQLALLDPTGARRKLFDPTNPEAAKVGDILLVRTKDGDPFAGVCIDIRRRGTDASILLRANLTRVGVEMWYKIYSPNVEGIEIVQARPQRARRARLYYMRLPKHDAGSVENVVRQYLRQRQSLGTNETSNPRGRDARSLRKTGKKSK